MREVTHVRMPWATTTRYKTCTRETAYNVEMSDTDPQGRRVGHVRNAEHAVW